jgi:hypothetical protein
MMHTDFLPPPPTKKTFHYYHYHHHGLSGVYEFVLHFETFKNVDLFRQGSTHHLHHYHHHHHQHHHSLFITLSRITYLFPPFPPSFPLLPPPITNSSAGITLCGRRSTQRRPRTARWNATRLLLSPQTCVPLTPHASPFPPAFASSSFIPPPPHFLTPPLTPPEAHLIAHSCMLFLGCPPLPSPSPSLSL